MSKCAFRLSETAYDTLLADFDREFWDEENNQLFYGSKISERWSSITHSLKNKELPVKQNFRNFRKSISRSFEWPLLNAICLLIYSQSLDDWKEQYMRENGESPFLPAEKSPQRRTSETVKFYFKPYPSSLNFLEKVLKGANREVWIFGTSLGTDIGNTAEFYRALKRGVTIRILSFNPESARLDDLAKELNVALDVAANYCKSSVFKALELMDYWHREAGSTHNPDLIRFRLTNNFPRMCCYVADPGVDGSPAFFVPTMNNITSTYLPGFACSRFEGGLADIYFECLRKEWGQATPIQKIASQCLPEELQRIVEKYPPPKDEQTHEQCPEALEAPPAL